jgi:NADH dehydrogenase [ubiquinone] 1 alpha subcomplex assembly factor 1
MSGADAPSRGPKALFTMNTPEDVADYYPMSDTDIGGHSTVHFELDRDPKHAERNGGRWSARFWGMLSTKVPEGMEGKMRSGYVGFRNNVCFSLSSSPLLCGALVESV